MMRRGLVLAIVSACLSVSPRGVAAETESRTSTEVTALRAQVDAAIAKEDFPRAWIAVREWRRIASEDVAAQFAQADLYFRLGAPAAVLPIVNRVLTAEPQAAVATQRSALALKARAHLASGEWAPAWSAFSRLLAEHGGNGDDALIAMARRARWEAMANATGDTAWDRFLTRTADAAAAPGAPASAHIRLARWLALIGDGNRGIGHLRTTAAASPEHAPALAGVLGELLLTRLTAMPANEARTEAFRAHRDEFARLAATSGVDPFLAGILRYYGSKPELPPLVAPKDLVGTVEGVLTALTRRRGDYLAVLERTPRAMEELAVEFSRIQQAGPVPDLAALETWERKMTAHLQAYEQAGRMQDVTLRMLDFLGGRVDEAVERLQANTPAGAELTRLKQVAARLEKVAEDSDDEMVLAGLAVQAHEALPGIFSSYSPMRRRAEARAELARANTPGEIFQATENALVAGDTALDIWRRRSETAEATGDIAEALASGARVFVAEWAELGSVLDRPLPASTTAWIERLDALAQRAQTRVGEAEKAWAAGRAEEAIAHLDAALAIDRASAPAWRLRWQWCEAMQDDAGAAEALEIWWRLDAGTPWDAAAAMGVAARAGAWPLLFALADARLNTHPADTEAAYFYSVAAIACDRVHFAYTTVPLLALTPNRRAGKELEAILAILTANNPATVAFPYAMTEAAAHPTASPGFAIWLAYADHLKREGRPVTEKASYDMNAPGTLHRQRLEGRISAEEYQQKTAGTTEESMASFVSLMIARRSGKSEATTEAAARVAGDSRLPLPLRAVAFQTFVKDTKYPVPGSLRASDLHYPEKLAKNGEGWGAPGQEVCRSVYASDVPPDFPVRMRGPLTRIASSVEVSTDVAPSKWPRLWEIRQTDLRVKEPQANDGGDRPMILDCTDVSGEGPILAIRGAAYLERVKLRDTSLVVHPGATLTMRDSFAPLQSANIAGEWNIHGGGVVCTGNWQIAAGGRVEASDTMLEGPFAAGLPAGARMLWRNVRVVSQALWPDAVPAGFVIEDARIVAKGNRPAGRRVQLAAPHRGLVEILDDGDKPGSITLGSRPDVFDELRKTVGKRTRAELWGAARKRFERDIAAAGTREAREAAIGKLGNSLGEAAELTEASRAESTRAAMELVIPVMLRHPPESPMLLFALEHRAVLDGDVLRPMIPSSLTPYLQNYAAALGMARTSLRQVETTYQYYLAYPPNHPDYSKARAAMHEGISLTAFQADLAAKKKREVELVAAREKLRKEAEAKRREAEKRAKLLAQQEAAAAATAASRPSRWTGSSGSSIPSAPPAWTPSASAQARIYRNNLDVQIARAVGKAW